MEVQYQKKTTLMGDFAQLPDTLGFQNIKKLLGGRIDTELKKSCEWNLKITDY